LLLITLRPFLVIKRHRCLPLVVCEISAAQMFHVIPTLSTLQKVVDRSIGLYSESNNGNGMGASKLVLYLFPGIHIIVHSVSMIAFIPLPYFYGLVGPVFRGYANQPTANQPLEVV